MIIGHLPAGYLAASALDRPFDEDPLIFWMVVLGAVLPDLDMAWFIFVDHGSVHHHTYVTHDPSLWLFTLFVGFVASSRVLIGIGIGALLHMSLDTIAGAITWGYGALSLSGPIVEVPAVQSHWVLNFVLHWVFVLEVLLWVAALTVFVRRRRRVAV